jgi:hypothetical protein
MPLEDSRDVLEGYSPDVLAQTCLTVQAPVMHIETCSVIVAFLQLLQVTDLSDLVRSHGGARRGCCYSACEAVASTACQTGTGLLTFESTKRDAVSRKFQ